MMQKVSGKELNMEKREPLKKIDLIMAALDDTEKDNYIISIENNTAQCRLCNMDVALTFKNLSEHIKICHKKNIEYLDLVDHGKLRAELAKYGKENFIKLNEIGSKGYCSLCNAHISAHIKIAVEHVNGARHRGHLELKGLVERKVHSVPGLRVMPLQQYLQYMFHNKAVNTFWINYSLMVDVLSFAFIVNIKEEKLKCFCCDMVINVGELKKHLETKKHTDSFMASDVLLMDDEFIRVIQPDLFHCGLCNQVFPFWESMNRHTSTWGHKMTYMQHKLQSKFALQCHGYDDKFEKIKTPPDIYTQLIGAANQE